MKQSANAVAESSYRVLYEQLPRAKRGANAVAESSYRALHEQLPRYVKAAVRVASSTVVHAVIMHGSQHGSVREDETGRL